MRCPSCGASEDRVVDSRESEDGSAVRRRRECLACRSRFSTVERLTHPAPLWVLKRSGEREPFERRKLVLGVSAACKNRPVGAGDVERLAREVEEVVRRGGGTVTSEEIGVAVLDRLREVDEVAYLRFASVYKGFDSAGDFAREAGLLRKHTAPKLHGGPDPTSAVPLGRPPT
jgi:transcriptional repressor NrdR